MHLKRAYLLLSLAISANVARAQGVPTWTIEFSAGAGKHTMQAGPIYFEGGTTATAWLAFSRSLAVAPSTALYLQAEFSPDLTLGEATVCHVTPNGGCQAHFDDRGGIGGTAGARFSPIDRLVLGAGAGAQRSNQQWRSIIDGDLSLALSRHFAVRGGVRYERWREAGNDVWFAPITAGLRLTW